MKRYITTIIAMLATVSALSAQTVNGVVVEGFTMERSGKYVTVDIALDITGLDVASSEVAVLTPYIVRDENKVALTSVGVYGRNRHFYYQRNEELAPTMGNDLSYMAKKAPEKVSYHSTVPFEEWMDGCQLIFERVDYGCRGLAFNQQDNVLIARFPLEPYIPELIYIRPDAEVVKSREVSGSAFVDFPVNQTVITPSYRNNVAELAKITGTIDEVKSNTDVTITSLTIKGFASPEGTWANNERLAQGRTEALKNYVEDLYQFEDGFIKTSYEPENWEGLREYVAASTLEHKAEILEAIDSDREPDAREYYIRITWPEEYRTLLDNCYPALRRSDYTVEYTVRNYTSVEEIEKVMKEAPQNLSLEEFYKLAQTYEPGSDELDELFEIAVRMYPDDEIANLNAANSAMSKGDYERALRYLAQAGNRPEVVYARGALEVLRQDYEAAMPYLEQAKELGVRQAQPTIDGITDYWKISKNSIK